MKILSTEGLTKLIQLIKSNFISINDTVTTTTVELADVATTGDYDDLIDKPTIPTVNNGTLTIQKNGTTIGVFTANQSTNSTINIEADTVLTDNTTITKNTNNELQTVAVIDNNTSNAIKTWTGTKAEYDAIVTKDANTLYNIIDDNDVTFQLLELIYPVGSIYIGTMSVCPLQILGLGTWQLVASDRVLQGAGTRGSVGDTLNESLPNIRGNIGRMWGEGAYTGALYRSDQFYVNWIGSTNGGVGTTINIDASRSSSTYQDDAPVQQDAYLVNIWERIS